MKVYRLCTVRNANLSSKEVRITKAVALKGNHSLPSSVAALVAKLHTLAAGIFHNTSHALELPWERYLAEMHELQAQGDDELRLSNGDPVELAWSTMVSQTPPRKVADFVAIPWACTKIAIPEDSPL